MFDLLPVHRVLLTRIAEGVLIVHRGRWAWNVEHRQPKRAPQHHVWLTDEQVCHVYTLIDAGLITPPNNKTPAQVV